MNIKKPNRNTDFSTASKMNWDFYLDGVPHEVIFLPEYYHQPDNNKYCYPLGTVPTYDNIIPFDSRWDAVAWSWTIKQRKATKEKWGDTRTYSSWEATLFRNGQEFHTICAHDKTYVQAKIEIALIEFGEHPIAFHFRDWDKNEIGRKIWYYDSPCVIERISGATFFIVGENGKIDCPYNWKGKRAGDMCNEEHWNDDYANGLNVDYDNPYVDWFRN